MKKFQFSLEKVLEVKEIEEKIIQKDLMTVQREILDNENLILEIQEKISQERINLSIINHKGAGSAEIMIHYKYLDSLQKRIDLIKNELKSLYQKENLLKLELTHKSQEKKSLERLKEIKFEEYKKDFNKSQQIILDEISIQNFRIRQESHK
jgi:flagellar FliJ protein